MHVRGERPTHAAVAFRGRRSRQSKWLLRSQLVDSRSPVVDVKFAPRHLGLRVATASLDGCVRTYEAVDVMNLAYWPVSAVCTSGSLVKSAQAA